MSVRVNRVVHGRYLDSVALMRLSRELAALPGVEAAAVMIGSETNQALMRSSGLLDDDSTQAGANDLVVGVRAGDDAAAQAALAALDDLLAREATPHGAAPGTGRHRSLRTALQALPGASLALISVPGEFAAAEAARALAHNLNVLLFSNNVSIDDERRLKELARSRGLLVMGPDCGTSLIDGVPLAFANVVPRGPIGVIAASGTGLQEVTTLIARGGSGISHGIGVGGRDLRDEVGGLTTLAALDALDADPATTHVVIVSKPPAPRVAAAVLDRVARSRKTFTLCLLGDAGGTLPPNARRAATLTEAAEQALGGVAIAADARPPANLTIAAGARSLRGLFCGGTLCAEAQLVLLGAGHEVTSNAPVPGATTAAEGNAAMHRVIDLGADEYTRGRPHPMIDPSIRDEALVDALSDPTTAVVLIDVVIGYGAHADPAGLVAAALTAMPECRAPVLASVTGTEGDPQGYSRQVRTLEQAGVVVAPSNAIAAKWAVSLLSR